MHKISVILKRDQPTCQGGAPPDSFVRKVGSLMRFGDCPIVAYRGLPCSVTLQLGRMLPTGRRGSWLRCTEWEEFPLAARPFLWHPKGNDLTMVVPEFLFWRVLRPLWRHFQQTDVSSTS